MEIFALLITGMLVGLISSFLGIGGGVLIVPVLYSLFPSISAGTVISTSLGTIFLTATLNTWRFYKVGLIPPRQVIIALATGALTGGMIGAFVAQGLNRESAQKIFGAVLILMILKTAFYKQDENNQGPRENPLLYFIIGKYSLN